MAPQRAFSVTDPTIRHVGISKLREVPETEDTFVIRDNNTPLAVLLRYEQFLGMQQSWHQ
jgi:hypothetical protein